jgi:hypothetical protein
LIYATGRKDIEAASEVQSGGLSNCFGEMSDCAKVTG